MKKLVFMALAMVLSFTGFAQTEELTSTSNNSDLKTAIEKMTGMLGDQLDSTPQSKVIVNKPVGI